MGNRVWALTSAVLLAAACGSESADIPPPGPPGPECASGTSQGCTCQDGLSGIRECRDSRWAACFCIPPTGGGDAEADPGDCAQKGRYFVDADGDGFGTGAETDVCEPAGPGYSAKAGDCDDQDARAFPGQTEPQEGLRAGIGGGDFNCDGAESLQWTKAGQCSGCSVGSRKDFWLGSSAPPCGGTATWVSLCSHIGGGVCETTSEQRAQKCL